MTDQQTHQNESTTEQVQTEQTDEKNLEEQCKKHICPTCPINAEATEIRLRSLAEMENFKKRLQREHDEHIKYTTERLLTELLPVLDSLDLAIQYGSKEDACKDMLTGVSMTRKLFLDILKPHGISVIGEISEPFNPDVHESVAYDIHEDIPEGHITVVHQRGYQLHDRLLRPAKVSVSQSSTEQLE